MIIPHINLPQQFYQELRKYEIPSYQPITQVSAGTDASNMMLFQENPSYISTHFPASMEDMSL